jgi:hypothetical protein
MHYKNGREAKLGDPVICKDNLGAITVGKISSISASSTCNANVVTVIMGGIETLSCRTLGECTMPKMLLINWRNLQLQLKNIA